MQIITDRPQALTAIRTDLGAIFISLELSRSTWLITSLSPGGGEKMSTHTVRTGDVAGLWARFSQLKDIAGPHGAGRSNHRDSGGGARRILNPPLASRRRGRNQRCWSRFNHGV